MKPSRLAHLQRRRHRHQQLVASPLSDHHRTSLALAIAEALGCRPAADRLADELAALQIDQRGRHL